MGKNFIKYLNNFFFFESAGRDDGRNSRVAVKAKKKKTKFSRESSLINRGIRIYFKHNPSYLILFLFFFSCFILFYFFELHSALNSVENFPHKSFFLSLPVTRNSVLFLIFINSIKLIIEVVQSSEVDFFFICFPIIFQFNLPNFIYKLSYRK